MILSVKDVKKSYGKHEVLKGITFDISEPSIIALIGPNGSGKTTLMSIITNLLQADSGEVTVLGKSNKDPKMFYDVSFLQDNTVLYDYLTGYDHLQFICDVQKIPKEKIIETAKLVGMDSYLDKKVKNYSLGMKQHLLLTMAIINDPKLLILDEPLNGLDPTSAIRVRELLLDLGQKGTTILLSSHNLMEIDRVTTQILFLKDGRLIKEDVSQYTISSYKIQTNDNNKAIKLLQKSNIKGIIKDGAIMIKENMANINDIFKLLTSDNIEIKDMEKKLVSSEDRYKQIFSDVLIEENN